MNVKLGLIAASVLAVSHLTSSVGYSVPFVPDFGAATFAPNAPIDNPLFPLHPGTLYTYSGEVEEDGEIIVETILTLVTHQTKDILGVQATVVNSKEFENGVLTEDTDDWFAQDTDGNVWYMGEDTTAFEYDDDGNLIGSHSDGAWQAGVNGALAGYIMPAEPTIGLNYYQEFAEMDEAIDQAEITSHDRDVSVPAGDFVGVLETLEFTDLAPGEFEHKLYAHGVGLVLIEEDLDESGVPGVVIELQSIATVPEPATTGLAAITGAAVAFLRRQRA